MVKAVLSFEKMSGLRSKMYEGHAVSLENGSESARIAEETILYMSGRGRSHSTRGQFLAQNAYSLNSLAEYNKRQVISSLKVYQQHLEAYGVKSGKDFANELEVVQKIAGSLEKSLSPHITLSVQPASEIHVGQSEEVDLGAEFTYSVAPSIPVVSVGNSRPISGNLERKLMSPRIAAGLAVAAGLAFYGILGLSRLDKEATAREISTYQTSASESTTSQRPLSVVSDEDLQILANALDNIEEQAPKVASGIVEVGNKFAETYDVAGRINDLLEDNRRLRGEVHCPNTVTIYHPSSSGDKLDSVRASLELAIQENFELRRKLGTLQNEKEIDSNTILINHAVANLPMIGPIVYADITETGLTPITPVLYFGDNLIDTARELKSVAIEVSSVYPVAKGDSWERYAESIGLSDGEARKLESLAGGDLDRLTELFHRMANDSDGVVEIKINGKKRIIARNSEQITDRRRRR